jgi:hypothetical protein
MAGNTPLDDLARRRCFFRSYLRFLQIVGQGDYGKDDQKSAG